MRDQIFQREEFRVRHGGAKFAVKRDLGHVHVAAAAPEQMLLGLRTACEDVALTEVQDARTCSTGKLNIIGVVGEGIAREVHGGGQSVAIANQNGFLIVFESVVRDVCDTNARQNERCPIKDTGCG